MDLNYLLHREGVERMRADGAVGVEARRAHLGLAGIFRVRVDGLRRASFAAATAGGPALVPPVL